MGYDARNSEPCAAACAPSFQLAGYDFPYAGHGLPSTHFAVAIQMAQQNAQANLGILRSINSNRASVVSENLGKMQDEFFSNLPKGADGGERIDLLRTSEILSLETAKALYVAGEIRALLD